MAITAKALGKTIPETGTTMFRPNYTPVTFGAIVGRDRGELFDPERFTAMHSWHVANGAPFATCHECMAVKRSGSNNSPRSRPTIAPNVTGV